MKMRPVSVTVTPVGMAPWNAATRSILPTVAVAAYAALASRMPASMAEIINRFMSCAFKM
ncbi:hypothetical protein [uncultured Massilia sp.]|uniref:hypothetical protein n=1 Tax=uncultured Massilia sp. TaxID=169973 RepID=UPI00258D24B4|nr:hypothetical protein [uncultured Massilia sp.]